MSMVTSWGRGQRRVVLVLVLVAIAAGLVIVRLFTVDPPYHLVGRLTITLTAPVSQVLESTIAECTTDASARVRSIYAGPLGPDNLYGWLNFADGQQALRLERASGNGYATSAWTVVSGSPDRRSGEVSFDAISSTMILPDQELGLPGIPPAALLSGSMTWECRGNPTRVGENEPGG